MIKALARNLYRSYVKKVGFISNKLRAITHSNVDKSNPEKFLSLNKVKGPILLFIVKEPASLHAAISIASRTALQLPKLNHLLVTETPFSDDLFLRVPTSLKIQQVKKKFYSDFITQIKDWNIKAVVLVDPNGCSDLFFETKAKKANVFWVNAQKQKEYNPMIYFFAFSNLLSQFSTNSYGHISVQPANTDTKQLIIKLQKGFRFTKNIGLLCEEPVTLPIHEKSKIDNFLDNNSHIIWFAANINKSELATVIDCQRELKESIPNICLVILLNGEFTDQTAYDELFGGIDLRYDKFSNERIILVDWRKEEIISCLRASRLTLLGGSLNKSNSKIFDLILPISYSSCVLTGPNYGQYSPLITKLLSVDGIKTINTNIGSSSVSYKNLYKSVFENLNSKTLANTISNAWQEMTEESSRLNLFINELKASIDE